MLGQKRRLYNVICLTIFLPNGCKSHCCSAAWLLVCHYSANQSPRSTLRLRIKMVSITYLPPLKLSTGCSVYFTFLGCYSISVNEILLSASRVFLYVKCKAYNKYCLNFDGGVKISTTTLLLCIK